MTKQSRVLLPLFLFPLGLVACGESVSEEEEPCVLEIGTYRMEIVDAGGTCPRDVVDVIAGVQDVEQKEEEACETARFRDTSTTQEGCELVFEVGGTTTNDSLSNGKATFNRTCPGALASENCTHNFNIYVTKR